MSIKTIMVESNLKEVIEKELLIRNPKINLISSRDQQKVYEINFSQRWRKSKRRRILKIGPNKRSELRNEIEVIKRLKLEDKILINKSQIFLFKEIGKNEKELSKSYINNSSINHLVLNSMGLQSFFAMSELNSILKFQKMINNFSDYNPLGYLPEDFTHFIPPEEIEKIIKGSQILSISEYRFFFDIYQKFWDLNKTEEESKAFLVHGDPKFENIVLDKKGLSLIDFGRVYYGSFFVDIGRYFNPQRHDLRDFSQYLANSLRYKDTCTKKEIREMLPPELRINIFGFSILHQLSHMGYLLEENKDIENIKYNLLKLKKEIRINSSLSQSIL